MNMSKNVRKFAGPHPIVIRSRCAACHPGSLSYHVSGSDDTEIMKEVIMTDSDMDLSRWTGVRPCTSRTKCEEERGVYRAPLKK